MQSKQAVQEESTSSQKDDNHDSETGPLRKWLNKVVDRNQQYFAEVMATTIGKTINGEETDPYHAPEEQRLLDAKLIMAYSGKSLFQKLEYGAKLAAMALGNYIEDTNKEGNGIQLLNREYEKLREEQLKGMTTKRTPPLMNSVLVARVAAYVYINLLGLEASRLQLFSINGSCWFSYTSVDRYGVSKRVQFCLEDIMIEFFTCHKNPIDRSDEVNKILKHLPYRFMLSKDERQREFEALLKQEDPDHIYTSASTNDSDNMVNILDRALIMSDMSSPGHPGSDDDSDSSNENLSKKMGQLDKDDLIGGEWVFQIDAMITDYVQPFIMEMENADKLLPGRFKDIKEKTIELFRQDKFLF